jgi:hypothetical protein
MARCVVGASWPGPPRCAHGWRRVQLAALSDANGIVSREDVVRACHDAEVPPQVVNDSFQCVRSQCCSVRRARDVMFFRIGNFGDAIPWSSFFAVCAADLGGVSPRVCSAVLFMTVLLTVVAFGAEY